MDKELEVLEMEYQELSSHGFDNYKFCLRVKTTPKTYYEDFAKLTIEVKSRLNEILQKKRAEKKK
ncbi:MAG: hypothetical protein M0P71_12845 [Melioribacteraceae bacterium]|jgi:hypothetical protein|nr:hypothetical protein [Melioribacteraceae bacterium]